jgi:aldehyde dehydrogenase (NAD+)
MRKATATIDVPHHPMFIDGHWTDGTGHYDVVNPANEQVVATVARADAGDADTAVAAALSAFRDGRWRTTPAIERAEVFERAADAIAGRADELARLVSTETGLPIRAALAFAAATPEAHLRYYAELTRSFAWERSAPVAFPASQSAVIRKEPLGVCVGICPWNLPAGISVWKTVPALAAGNSVVLKADEKAPRFALELAAILRTAGLPDGVLNVVVGDGAVGDHLVRHPDVRLVSFTGSTQTGRHVMAAASATIKRVHLELGGKSPSIVLADADLDLAVDGTIYGFALHSGQACESGTRVLIPEVLHDEFVDRLIDRLRSLRIGDPLDPETDLGPVMDAVQRDRILRYIESGISDGAELVYGGGTPDLPEGATGYWIEPTVFTGVTNEMRIAREEIFGPVLAITTYSDIEEAVRIANDTEYGLAAGIWSRDRERALGIASRLEAGSVWINDWHNISAHLPFGGYKQNGVGRELGPDARVEFTQDKSISLDMSGDHSQRGFGLIVKSA